MVRPGTLTTVQDLGRPGLGRLGVSPSGAMDPVALRAANALAGAHRGAAALEVTGPGLELDVLADGVAALAGADLEAQLDGVPLAPWRSFPLRAGTRLRCGGRRQGARAYLAVRGGFRVPLVMGSAATDLDAGLGGISGRPLRRGDLLEAARGERDVPVADEAALDRLRGWYREPDTLGVVVGADGGSLPGRTYVVGQRSGRMGYRLAGEPLAVARAGEAISEPIAPGAVQVAADGQPLLLMADRPTVGGYPVVAHVVQAHLPRAAQLWPGDPVRFVAVSLTDAWRMARALAADVAALEHAS